MTDFDTRTVGVVVLVVLAAGGLALVAAPSDVPAVVAVPDVLRPCSPSTPAGAACRWEPSFIVDVRAEDEPGVPRLAAIVLEETHLKERIVVIETDVVFSTGPGRWRCGDPARRWRGLLTWEACDGRRER